MKIPMRFAYDLGASNCAFTVSATIRVVFTELSNRSGIAVQWNVCFRHLLGLV